MKKLIIPIILLAGAYFFIPKFKELVNGLFSKIKTPAKPVFSAPTGGTTLTETNNSNNQN